MTQDKVLTIEFKRSIKAIQYTDETYLEVLQLLLKNEIKTHIETDDNVIVIRETYVPSVYHCLRKGDYLVMFPYIDERIFRCKVFTESDFEKGFKVLNI